MRKILFTGVAATAYAFQYPRWSGSLIGVADPQGEQIGSTNPLRTNGEVLVPTYACSVQFDPAAAATDAFTITGSATKTVRVRYLSLDAVSTANSQLPVFLVKRGSADTGGTSTSPTAVPLDSADPAGTAVCTAYTANPTLGTTIGAVRTTTQPFTSSSSAIPPEVMRFGAPHGDKSLVLRGTSQQLAVNYAGATIPSGAWTEN